MFYLQLYNGTFKFLIVQLNIDLITIEFNQIIDLIT